MDIDIKYAEGPRERPPAFKLVYGIYYTTPQELLCILGPGTREKVNAGLERVEHRIDIVCAHSTSGVVRCLEMHMFEEHPAALRGTAMLPDDYTEHVPATCNGQIFHRLDLILPPTHKWYAFHEQVARFENSHKLLGKAAVAIGHRGVWRKWIEDNMSTDLYDRQIDAIRRCTTPTFYTTQ